MTARVKRLAVASILAAALCGMTAAGAAEKAPAKTAAAKAPPAKAQPAKDSPAKTPPPKPADAPQPSETRSPEAGPADEVAGDDADPAAPTGGGLPIPRFVSLRTNPINLRTGPGVRYPVDWVYVKRHLPVEVIGEFDTWRRIRDQDGAEGWVHQSMLSGKRTAVVKDRARQLKRAGEDTADLVATLEAGVVVNLVRCPRDTAYCRVEVDGLQGWLKREDFWGVYPDEAVQ